jgi:hypothetical protein
MNRVKAANQGSLTVEATIAFTIFMMVVLSFVLLLRLVYAHALIQHAVSQTAKELSVYTYLYQVTGLNKAYQDAKDGMAAGASKANDAAANLMDTYSKFTNFDGGAVEGLANAPGEITEILENIPAALGTAALTELNDRLFESVVRPMLAGYIAADSAGADADAKLLNLQVVDGMQGLNLTASRFFDGGNKIDIVVCYKIDLALPINVLPELNLMNRAVVRGMNGTSIADKL